MKQTFLFFVLKENTDVEGGAASIEITKAQTAYPGGFRHEKTKIVRPRAGSRAFPEAVLAKASAYAIDRCLAVARPSLKLIVYLDANAIRRRILDGCAWKRRSSVFRVIPDRPRESDQGARRETAKKPAAAKTTRSRSVHLTAILYKTIREKIYSPD